MKLFQAEINVYTKEGENIESQLYENESEQLAVIEAGKIKAKFEKQFPSCKIKAHIRRVQ